MAELPRIDKTAVTFGATANAILRADDDDDDDPAPILREPLLFCGLIDCVWSSSFVVG